MRPILLCLISILGFSAAAQNNSLLFDGVDDKVILPENPAYDLTDNFTIEAWIYAVEWRANSWQGTIVAKDNDPQTGYVFRCGADGTLSWTVGTGSSWTEVTSTPVMNTDTWHHVAAVLEDGQSRIYIDGTLVGSTACPAAASSSTQLHIGESSGFAGRVFDGRLDEIRLWNVARTAEEIADNATVDLAADTPGLVAYLKMDESSGAIASNEVDPGNFDGELINFSADPWESGYTLPGIDMKAEAIISPDVLTLSEGLAQVKVRCKNNGLEPVSDLTVAYSYNGGTEVSQSLSLELEAGATYDYTFPEAVAPSGGDSDAITATCTTADDSNVVNDAVAADYVYADEPLTVTIFDGEQHNFAGAGQTQVATLSLPEDNSAYGQVFMNISLDCPQSGCDPWDQPAKISLIKDGITYEIARYITPYGISCGPWVIDVTDFRSILTGTCDFVSYIQVWGGSGWLLNASLSFVPGDEPHPYQEVLPVYDTDNWVYGDPGIEDDLETRTLDVHSLAEQVDYRLTVTGHGQANTDNAAEFSPKTHAAYVNGTEFYQHFLWKDDCESNSCANQNGTWLFDRAGWCPGQGVDPLTLDITSEASPGSTVDLDYELEEYTNLLNTGYNGGSHTEPHYKIHAYMIVASSQYLGEGTYVNSTASMISSPSEIAELTASSSVTVDFMNNGTDPSESYLLKVYVNGEFIAEEAVDLAGAPLMPGESYSHTFTQAFDLSEDSEDLYLSVLVIAEDDEVASDNVTTTHFDIVSSLDELGARSFSIYPNPADDQIIIYSTTIQANAQLSIMDAKGAVLLQESLSNVELSQGKRLNFDLPSGFYLVEIRTDDHVSNQPLLIE